MAESPQTPQFIEKLLAMMEVHVSIIGWSETENEIVIKDVKKMAEVVIPAYFRHNKYESFVRQLNMYNFHKVCREKNNTINFKNDIFFKRNQVNFHKIKRKKKTQAKHDIQNSKDQIVFVQTHPTLPSTFKDLLIKLITYKAQAETHMSDVKCFMSGLSSDIRTPKFKKFEKDISEMKSMVDAISEKSDTVDDLFVAATKTMESSSTHSFQSKLNQVLNNQLVMSTIVGMCGASTQQSVERTAEENGFQMFTTKLSIMDVVNGRQRWALSESDHESVCSIENDLDM